MDNSNYPWVARLKPVSYNLIQAYLVRSGAVLSINFGTDTLPHPSQRPI